MNRRLPLIAATVAFLLPAVLRDLRADDAPLPATPASVDAQPTDTQPATSQPADSARAPRRAPVIDPLPAERPAPPQVAAKTYNPIDAFIAAQWRQRSIRPAPPADDLTFLRRAHLDLCGVIPTLDDVQRFRVGDKADCAALVDRLLTSPRYAQHWTAFWGDLLRETTAARGAEPFAFRNYIHAALRDNKPYDVWVREMITASGSTAESPAAAFIIRNAADPDELTIATTQVFLGTRLKCVQCHDSFLDDGWLQRDFLGIRDFYSGTKVKLDRVEEVVRPGRKPRMMRFLEAVDRHKGDGEFFTGAVSDKGTGREGLADLVTRRDNPYFARVAVNWIWCKLMGVGLVDPPDEFHPDNPPSHPDLLDWLALEFIDSGYDLKHLIRLICTSRAYQLSSAGGTTVSDGTPIRTFERMPIRRMTAEQLWDSLVLSCGAQDLNPRRFQWAFDMPYPARPSTFLATFAAHDRQIIGPRSQDATIPQALELMNGQLINRATSIHREHPVVAWLKAGDNAETIARRLFLSTLTREPTADELKEVLRTVAAERDREAWADVHWALFNTREFMFLH